MKTVEQVEIELRDLIVKTLDLEDTKPEQITNDMMLFADDGLGLDSIDALELGVALHKTYGIKIEAASEEVRQHFASVSSLAAYICSQLKSE